MEQIPQHRTDLWLAFPQEIRDPALLGRYRVLLDDEERARERRFHFEEDSHRYLVTRALVRTVLSRYAPVGPESWIFRSNARGRPEIANAGVAPGSISFNLSRTRDLVLCAVTGGRRVGADVENIERRELAASEVASRSFSAREFAGWSALPAGERLEGFFHYWTLKEAYIKARGMGLSIPLERFSFAFSGGGIELSIDARLGDSPAGWQFWLLRPTPRHVAAVCTQRLPLAQDPPHTRKTVPLVSDETFECPVLRQSGPAAGVPPLRERMAP
jgi:4'-phosphopantetheinyl transferase